MNDIKKSIELFEKGSYKKALKIFNLILKHNPLDDLIWRYKGEAFAKLGNFKDAIDCYNKAIEILPEYMTEALWMLKGRALSQSSEFDYAIDCFNQALKIKPDSETAEKEKQATIKLKEEALKATENEIEALTMRINDAYETHQNLRRKGIQSDVLHSTLYDALRNENFKERMLDELLEIAKDRKPTKDKPAKQEVLNYIMQQNSEVLGIDPVLAIRKGTVRPENADEHRRKIRELEEAIIRNPNNSNLIYKMGNNYLGLGLYDLAIKSYNEALKLNPTNFWFYLMKGTAYLLSERYHNAFECSQEALKMKPGDPKLNNFHELAGKIMIDKNPIYTKDLDKERDYLSKQSQSTIDGFKKGTNALNSKRFEEALFLFDNILRVNSKYAPALLQKGNIYFNRGEFKEAIKYYDEIIELNLDLATLMLELWVNKGVCHRRIKENEKAIYCYKKALEINPKDFDTVSNMGNILSDLGRLDEALESYNSAIKLAKEENYESAKMMCNKGIVLAKMKRYHEALYITEKAIEIDPVFPPSWFAKGLAHKGLNEPTKALECFNESLKYNPRLAIALYEKAYLLRDLGDYREALVCFDILARIRPNLISNDQKEIQLIRKLASATGSADKFSVWYEKGLRALENNEYANAILHFDKCLDNDLNDANVWLHIAEAYNSLKRYEYAEQCLNKALQINPNNPDALKIRDKMGSHSFFDTELFFYLKNPIKGVKVEGNNLREKITRALKIFRPYLILDNIELKLLDIKNNKMVHVGIIDKFNKPPVPNLKLYADLESFLRTINPALNMVPVMIV